jgi:hypothetical protein
MSLSHELAQLNDNDLREALRVLAKKILAKGGGGKDFDNWMRPVNRAFHRGGWTNERLYEFRRTYRHKFHNAKLTFSQAIPSSTASASADLL